MTLHCPSCRDPLHPADCILVRLSATVATYTFRCSACGETCEKGEAEVTG